MSLPERPERAEISAHLIRLLYQGTFSTIVVHTINAALMMAMLREYVAVWAMNAWGVAFVGIVVLRLILYRAFLQAQPNAQKTLSWLKVVKTTSFFTGLVWGAAAWVFMPAVSVEHQLFTTMILIIIAAGAASKLYPVFSVYLLFIAPMSILAMARLVVIGTQLHFAMAAAAFVLLAFLTFFAIRHRDDLVQSLELIDENKALLDRLEDENRAVLDDYSQTQKMEILLRQKTAVLDAVSKIQGLFIAERDPSDIFDETLDTILQLTDSTFGFIGEVHVNAENQRSLKMYAISDAAWNDQTRADMKSKNPHGFEFHERHTLYGEVLETGEPVMANDPAHDERSAGVPMGHAKLKNFLGVPLYLGEDMVGMVGLANREDGYNVELLTALDPVISATGRMIEALQIRRARAETQEQLAEAKNQAEKASKAKTEFLSSMSHELRTPMNAVLGFAQLMQLNPQVPLHPKQADSVEQILKGGNHLLELINEVLDLSRIESGRVNLNMEDIDPHEVLEDCVHYITPLAHARGLNLDVHIPQEKELSIHTDPTRFRQVLLNLLSNAVKYNVDGGTVTLSVNRDLPGKVRFYVNDTGPGIPPEKCEEIFEPFARLGAESTEVEGTGIGLTISRKLTELMGGQVDFESTLNEGSKFWVDMPGCAFEAVSVDVKPAQPSLPNLPDGTHTILYVEDNPDNLNLMQQVIDMVDHSTLISAHTGELGVEMAEIHMPDVILMDINLPGISGIEVLHRLRNTVATQDIPVIAVSADAMAEDVRRGMAEGFDAYLTKPINLGEVVEHISQALEGTLRPRSGSKDQHK